MRAASVDQRGQCSAQGAARVVSLVGLLDLLDSLALLVTRGQEPWLLDVVWTGPAQPWYVDLCRKRCAALGLASHVRFLGSEDLPAHLGGARALAPGAERSVVVLESMVNRRTRRDGSARDRRRFDDAGSGTSLRRFTTRSDDSLTPRRTLDPATARARQRAASRYQAMASRTSTPRRPIVDALA